MKTDLMIIITVLASILLGFITGVQYKSIESPKIKIHKNEKINGRSKSYLTIDSSKSANIEIYCTSN